MKAVKEILQEVSLPRSSSPKLDAELLLCHVLHVTREKLYTYPERMLTDAEMLTYHTLFQKRSEGVPIAYLVGKQAFWTFDLIVNEHVLIPRPDTETLVEAVLDRMPQDKACVIDLGTGTGAIACALASSQPEWDVFATDLSSEALKVAVLNAKILGLSVNFIRASWLDGFKPKSFDAIVSNPPYIAGSDPHLLAQELQCEPQRALIAEEDGLKDLRTIIKQAPIYLKPNGLLAVEHGYDQGEAVREFFQANRFENIKTIRDLGNQERVTLGQLKNV